MIFHSSVTNSQRVIILKFGLQLATQGAGSLFGQELAAWLGGESRNGAVNAEVGPCKKHHPYGLSIDICFMPMDSDSDFDSDSDSDSLSLSLALSRFYMGAMG